MSLITDMQNKIGAFINRILKEERKANLDFMIEVANNWKPAPARDYTFTDEMQRRIQYYIGSMVEDMQSEIDKHFPQTANEMKDLMVNLPLVKSEMNTKAKIFVESGDIYLVDSEKRKVEGKDQDNFSELIEKAMIWSNLKQIDAYTQLCSRAMYKPWWDTSANHVRIGIWPQHMVHIVPDPKRWWDVDSAFAVLFVLPAIAGITGAGNMSFRYECFGYRDTEARETTQKDTFHFITDGTNDYYVNDDDVNPFKNPENNNPIYPFVWWRSDATMDLYSLGNEDCLTINRFVNRSLTDMAMALKYQAFGIWVHSKGEGAEDLGVKTLSPSTVVDVAYGSSLSNQSTNLQVDTVWSVIREIIDTDALLNNIPSHAVRADRAPESGYALKIRNRPLIEHRTNLIDIYNPYVIDSLRRTIIVHNTYCESNKRINPKLEPVWIPGEMTVPEDPRELGEVYAAEIESDVSTPIDWRSARYSEDYDMAEEAIKKNAELNKELASNGKIKPEFGFEGKSDAEEIALNLFPKEEKEKEEDEEVVNEEKIQ